MIVLVWRCLKKIVSHVDKFVGFFFFKLGTILSHLSPYNQIAGGCHMRFSSAEDEMARPIVSSSVEGPFKSRGCSGRSLLFQSCQVFFLGTAQGPAERSLSLSWLSGNPNEKPLRVK